MKYNTKTVEQINWLGSTHLQSFTYLADADKEYVSGQVYKKNGVAIGLVLNDVHDSTDDPMPASVMVEGYVLGQRLPIELDDTDKAALKAAGIKFLDDEPEQPDDEEPAGDDGETEE